MRPPAPRGRDQHGDRPESLLLLLRARAPWHLLPACVSTARAPDPRRSVLVLLCVWTASSKDRRCDPRG